jgi:tRNA(Ile)-lysidine synthase
VLTAPQGLDLSELFSSFDLVSRGSVIAAVSGGSDSTALLLLLKDHLDRLAPATTLVAVTVDHALRPESATEAAGVARLCAKLGVAHRIARWTGKKPTTGLAAAAREARHRLLAEAAADEKTDLVLTGHTANDQAETVLMRQARNEAGRGLAGIAPATLFDGRVWFARPLVAARREALRALLRERNVRWIDDPTNADERQERPRLRKRLAADDGEAAIATALNVAAAAAEHRETAGHRAAALIRAGAEAHAPGLLRLRPGFLAAADRDATLYALRILLAIAGGSPHLPDEARSAELTARLASGQTDRAVLSRALVDRRSSGIFLLRELRDLPDRDALRAGAIWDGRYRIVDALQDAGDRAPAAAPPGADTVPDSLKRMAAASQPVLPAGWSATPVLAPWARYLPSFDVAAAQAAGRLVGAAEIRKPPLREHIESKA